MKESSYRFECYYCKDCSTDNVIDYERHVVLTHMPSPSDVNHPAYPCKADLERLGLKAQGKYWEI